MYPGGFSLWQQPVFRQRLKEGCLHLGQALSQPDRSGRARRQSPQLCDGLVASADNDGLSRLQQIEILGEVSLNLVNVELNHSQIVGQVADQVNSPHFNAKLSPDVYKMSESLTKLATIDWWGLSYTENMISEQLSRSQLQRQLSTRMEELRQEGYDRRHLKDFVKKVRAIPGQTVGDICHNWSRSQAELRPLFQLLWLAVALLVGALLLKGAGTSAALTGVALVGLAGFLHGNSLWEKENRFTNELLARADSASLYLARPPI